MSIPVRQTLADRLRIEIADEILTGKLPPGITLDEADLARRFDVSRTPVREAIRLLAAGGLVEARPHRSAIVARPTRSDIVAMFEALRELEAICAGLAASRMSQQECEALATLNSDLAEAVDQVDVQRYHEINEQFHAAIYLGSHNPYLAEITAATRARIAPFSRAQFRTPGRIARSHQEHAPIVRAIRERDPAAATAAMKTHIATVHVSYEQAHGE
jgi:DNA-binding GntR family transcriptional regulator